MQGYGTRRDWWDRKKNCEDGMHREDVPRRIVRAQRKRARRVSHSLSGIEGIDDMSSKG